MTKQKLVFFLLIIGPIVHVSAQKTITISGFVRDSISAENLYHATIFDNNTKQGALSNAFGFYSLSVPTGKVQLQVSFVGYKEQRLAFDIQSDTTINFQLHTKNDLQEVTVKAKALSSKPAFAGHEQIDMQTVKALPAFAGEQDVLKSLTVLPGVQQGHEGSAGIFVRGGSPDQNLILLDGVPIYNATHLFGFVSVFTPEALQSVDFYKGGFPARYGGRLSSVVDVRMKEGNKNHTETDITIGPITSKLTHQGPIKKNKSSYLISARRTLLDLFITSIAKISQMSNNEVVVPSLNLYDLNAKFNFELNDRNHLYVSLYGGGDLLSSDFKDNYSYEGGETKQNSKVKLKWGNRIGALRWTSQLGNRLYLNTTLSSGSFRYTIHNKYDQTVTKNGDKEKIWSDIEYKTRVNNNKIQFLFDWYLPKNKIQFGTSAELNSYLPGEQEIERHDGQNTQRGNGEVNNKALALFMDDQLNIGDKLTVHGGLRLDLYDLGGKWHSYITPRANAKWVVYKNLSLFLSYDQMVQPLHLLTNSSVGLPSDIWVPATEDVKPETSQQITFGSYLKFNNKFSYKFDSYFKTMDGVINYKAGNSFMDIYDNWEELVETGVGEAWGFENSWNYKTSRLNAWVNYTLSWNNRKFESINEGKAFPFKFDRRHDINLGYVYNLTDNIEFSAVWTYQTGMASTIPVLDYQAAGPIDYWLSDFVTGIDIEDTHRIQYFEEYNNYRLPAFHHLDLGITFKKQKGNLYREWKLGVYNAYARKNAYMYYPQTSPTGETKYKQICIFPFIPSISYHLKF
ncbi:TonB-dependent receptor [Sunxiuqinia rutila]|uniref:TonB-dependent receptor n=1 Tax=Sunxiuqinia rutila TaxID=1397841 RepID=UPI003D367318